MLVVNDKISIPWEEFEISYARSAGPGGQNVNKRETKVVLDWDIVGSPSLSPAVLKRFTERFGSRLTGEGHLVISSDEHRSREANERGCYDKVREMLLLVANPPKLRVATKPTKGAKQRRLSGKKMHSDVKKNRQKVKDF